MLLQKWMHKPYSEFPQKLNILIMRWSISSTAYFFHWFLDSKKPLKIILIDGDIHEDVGKTPHSMDLVRLRFQR